MLRITKQNTLCPIKLKSINKSLLNISTLPVYHSQWNSCKERRRREIVFRFDDSEPGFGAGDHEVEAADADHPMQGRAQTRLDNAETETDDDHQHSVGRKNVIFTNLNGSVHNYF